MKEVKRPQGKLLLGMNILFVLVILVLVFVIVNISKKKEINKNIISRDESGSFLYTNPILDCESSGLGNNAVIFSKDLNTKVEQLKNQYSLTYISLYFRDLNNGPWVGVHEKEVFSPASLLKVPIFMAYLYQAQSDPSILDKKVIIDSSDINQTINQNITFDNVLAVGQEYTLLQAAESMIQKSDNAGVTVLLRNINANYIGNIFKSIGVPFKDTTTEVDVRVKDYAGFFRVLFNASYLNREMSEKALEILTRSDYNSGIVAGVSEGTKVAHKFGERKVDGSTETQLHDCGIVYYPSKPYILCIMTRGNNFKNQEKVIQEISTYVYSEVDKNIIEN